VSYGFGLMIESLVALLLMLTIGYCMILNQRLKRLKADEHALKATISELITATGIAERAVAGLKVTVRECEQTLGERLKTADHFCTDLGRQITAGEIVINRLSRIVVAARPILSGAPDSGPPNAQIVAMEAQAFAERTRERASALAA
jgi:hypothetical protein